MTADRSVYVRLRADISDYLRKMSAASAATGGFVKSLDTADSRMANLVQTALALGPALIPLGATAVPALAGLTAGLAAAAGAGGVVALAFSGVGDAVKAVNEYALDKTPEKLDKVRESMAKLGPEGRDMVRMLQDLRPAIAELRGLAQGEMFPGMAEGFAELSVHEERLERFVGNVSKTLGDLAARGGDALNDDEWIEFFDYVNREAQPILEDMAQTLGNVVEGTAGLLMGLDPLTDQFWAGMVEASAEFSEWSKNLEDDDGFQSFIEYVERVGPKAVDTFGSLVDMLAAVVAAGAPVGEATLPVLKALATVLEQIAESPAGPVLIGAAAGLSAVSRAVALFKAANGSAISQFLGKTGEDGKKAGVGFRGAAAGLGIFALAMTDVDDNLGLANTAMGASIGLMAGPWGAAVGGAIGLMLDMASSSNDFKVSSEGLVESLDQQTGAVTANTKVWAANELEKNGVLAAAEGLGLSLNDVTAASLGNADAIERVTAALAGQRAAFFDSNDHLQTSTSDLQDFDEAANLVAGAVEVMGGKVGDAQGQFRRVTEATGETADSMDNAAAAAMRFDDALRRLNDRLDGRAAMRDYEQAVDDFTEALKENGRAVDIGSEKGRAMEAALDKIASTALAVAEGLQGVDREEYLKQARRTFIAAATDLYGTKEAARQVANELLGLNQVNAQPKVKIDLGPLRAGISAAKAWLGGIPDEDVYINLKRRYMGAAGQGVGPAAINEQPEYSRGRGLRSTPTPSGRAGAGMAMRGSSQDGWSKADLFEAILKGSQEAGEGLKGLKKRLREAEQALERETRQRDAVVAKMDDIRGTIRGELTGSLFELQGGTEASEDPWAAGATAATDGVMDPDAALAHRKDRAKRMLAAIKTLRKAGIRGAALQELIGEGLEALEFMASQPTEELGVFAAEYAATEALVNQAANFGAESAWGKELRQQTKELREVQKELREIKQAIKNADDKNKDAPERTGAAVGRAINGAAATGKGNQVYGSSTIGPR